MRTISTLRLGLELRRLNPFHKDMAAVQIPLVDSSMVELNVSLPVSNRSNRPGGTRTGCPQVRGGGAYAFDLGSRLDRGPFGGSVDRS